MSKVPELTISLKQLEKMFLTANPMFKVIPLKIRMAFSDLTTEEIGDLEEYANVEDGSLERWILLPDSTTIGSLTYIVNRAFGFFPRPGDSYIALEDKDWDSLLPSMGDFLDACGSIFENPVDLKYGAALGEMAIISRNLIPPFLPAMVFPFSFSYAECQEKIRNELEPYLDSIEMDGKKLPLRSAPSNLELLSGKAKSEELSYFSENLSPDLFLKDVLAKEGNKAYGIKDRPKGKRKAMERWSPKPFTHKLLMYRFDEEDYVGFTFEITQPRDVYALINEGFITAEEYLSAIKSVLTSFAPVCIYKKGYDLFGSDQFFYHEFIMALHGREAETYRREATLAGWREPYMDLSKVFSV